MDGYSIAVLQSRPLLMSSPQRLAGAAAGLALACALTAFPALAQQAPAGQAVVQSVPSSDPMNLNAALARLGRNPRDVQALIDAGRAALAIGDIDAAVGFFSRAFELLP